MLSQAFSEAQRLPGWPLLHMTTEAASSSMVCLHAARQLAASWTVVVVFWEHLGLSAVAKQGGGP